MVSLPRLAREQIQVSKNINEPWPVKVRRGFWFLVYFFKAVVLGLDGMRSEQLGSKVVFRGKRFVVGNWANSERPTLYGKDRDDRIENAPRSEVKNIVDFGELIHRFRMKFSWYATNWLSIEVYNRLQGVR